VADLIAAGLFIGIAAILLTIAKQVKKL